MDTEQVLTNDFVLHYDEDTDRLLIYALENGKKPEFPIALKLKTLTEMGPQEASKWFGDTVLLLIPAMRKHLFHLTSGSDK